MKQLNPNDTSAPVPQQPLVIYRNGQVYILCGLLGPTRMADLCSRTQQKLHSNGEGAQQEVLATETDALTDAFNAIADWEYPAIAPATIVGCLPL